MSDLFVDNIKHQSSQGSGTITLGTSGEKITTASGAEFSAITGHMYPAFEAYLTSETTVSSNNTYTKIQFDTEVVDTDNAFDNSTNYRFTVPSGKAGKYFIQVSARCISSSNSTLEKAYVSIYKNGTQYRENQENYQDNEIRSSTVNVNAILDLSVNDYIEGYVAIKNSSGTRQVGDSNSQYKSTYLLGYRLGA